VKRHPRSSHFFTFLFFEGRRRLYPGYLWITDVNIVPVYNCINYFCLFGLWQLKRCWQTTLLSNFTTHDQHMKPVYRRPLMSVHRLAEKLFAMSTLKSEYKVDFCTSFSFLYNRPPAENRCTRNWYSNKKLIGGLTSDAYFQRAEIQVNIAHRLGFFLASREDLRA